MTITTALIVDDEPDIRELIELTLLRMDIKCDTAKNYKEAINKLDTNTYNLCLTDMHLPDGDGLDLVAHIQRSGINLPVAVITAYGNVEAAVKALKHGAFDFVSKPVDLSILRNLVNSAIKTSKSEYPKTDRRSRRELLGDSKQMQAIRAKIVKLSRSQAPVYISGESGTGKELIARLIHEKGPRADEAFVPVNCGAIPADLMESEFFGHKKGSFTGATADKEGLFKAASGGTLFLDEVADLPLHMQVKLLRAIQEKAVRAIGSEQEELIDVRILSATRKDLAKLVEDGSFRLDLYYRLNVINLHSSSLRERPDDIPVLASHVLEQLCTQMELDSTYLSDDALEHLSRYSFPGNVRELENILERALTLCEGELIHTNDLQLPETTPNTASKPQITTEPQSTAAPEDDGNLENYLDDIEKRKIMEALEKTRFNKTQAAKLLGISFRALRYRLKKLDLD